MAIRKETMIMTGAPLGDENPLPYFQSVNRSKELSYDDSFLEEDKKLFGYETGFRILPYNMQDNYSRDRRDMEFNVIILENENLKARFLADYGGRLASLEDKRSGRELLFRNSVFQPANLANRDAWFSGGIEWNIGQFGHSVLTCSPLFFAKMKDDENREFLRAYEYERSHKFFFSIDFHLPPRAEQLGVHVRIINDNEDSVPMYWWTNTAVREERDIRIFSATDQVIYIKPESIRKENSEHNFGRSSLVDLPSLPRRDASYPMNFNFSSEYFFQTPESVQFPWQASVYNDGETFYDRSTSNLKYRKMFCWGTHKGGRNWCDYLSAPSQGEYLEVQAGMAPTQVHGMQMPGSATWDFSQFFGSMIVDSKRASGDWKSAKEYVESSLDDVFSSREVERKHREFQRASRGEFVEMLHMGSGWGALEGKRRNSARDIRPMPPGLYFPDESIGEDQNPWIELLERGKYPDSGSDEIAGSWIVDPLWIPILENNVRSDPDNPWPLIHLGVINRENNSIDKALECWRKSIDRRATPIAWRNIAVALLDCGNENKAIEAYKNALSLKGTVANVYLIRELMELLIDKKQYAEAWKYYSALPEKYAKMERVLVPAAIAAFEIGDLSFVSGIFDREYAYIKEGETRLVELWNNYQAHKLALERGTVLSDALREEVRQSCPPPKRINFMMTD